MLPSICVIGLIDFYYFKFGFVCPKIRVTSETRKQLTRPVSRLHPATQLVSLSPLRLFFPFSTNNHILHLLYSSILLYFVSFFCSWTVFIMATSFIGWAWRGHFFYLPYVPLTSIDMQLTENLFHCFLIQMYGTGVFSPVLIQRIRLFSSEMVSTMSCI